MIAQHLNARRAPDTEVPIRIRHVTSGHVENPISSNLQSRVHPNHLAPPSDCEGIASIPDRDMPVPRTRTPFRVWLSSISFLNNQYMYPFIIILDSQNSTRLAEYQRRNASFSFQVDVFPRFLRNSPPPPPLTRRIGVN